MIDKVVRNVYGIGAAIITSAFGISFISTSVKTNRMPVYGTAKVFSGEINDISDIEDLEYAKGCKFLFYDKELVSSNKKFEITGARDFNVNESKKSTMFSNVREKIDECKPGRFFYNKI